MINIGQSSVLHRVLSGQLPEVVSGHGAWLSDDIGRRYLDACGGAAVSCLGHGDRRVGEAIADQLARIAYAHTSFFTNRPAERLAQALIRRAPHGFGHGRAMFLGSGSEAMEAALKLARQYAIEVGQPSRTVIIARAMAYHGNTLGALAVGGHMQRRAPYAPLLIDVARVSACHAYRHQRAGESEDDYSQRLADELEAEIARVGPDRVLAFVAETISGATLGCVPPTRGYFARVREVCDRHGVLFIADEVMCGSGRTGTFYAIEQEKVAPDIMTIAKGLGAGFQPIAATLASEKVVAALQAGSGMLANGHTYMSHAVACAGALAVVEAIDRDRLLADVIRLGKALRSALVARFGDHPRVGDIRGRGLFQAIEFVADRDTKAPMAPGLRFAQRLKANAMAEGLLIYPTQGCADGVAGDHVVLAPPYIVTDDEIEAIVDRLARAIERTISAREAAE